jgi:hypothetical protein
MAGNIGKVFCGICGSTSDCNGGTSGRGCYACVGEGGVMPQKGKAMGEGRKKPWMVPGCAEHVKHLVDGDGGNDHGELMNRVVVPGSNDIVVAMQLQVGAQYALLERLHRQGWLRDKDSRQVPGADGRGGKQGGGNGE